MNSFLTERFSFEQAKVTLEGGGLREDGTPKELFMKGIFIQGGIRNHNRRIYPIQEIQKAVEKINNCISRGESIFGEADHPKDFNINMDRISHVITNMYIDGNNGIGKLKILPTPTGNICRVILESGEKLGVSSRGSGDVDANGYVSNFDIVTVDIVARPSAPEAYPIAVYESLNSKRGSIIEDLAKNFLHDARARELLKNEVLEWIRKI